MRKFIIRILVFSLMSLILLSGVIIASNILINKDSNFSIDKKINRIVLGHSHPEGAFNDSLISNNKNFEVAILIIYFALIEDIDKTSNREWLKFPLKWKFFLDQSFQG